MGVKESVYGSYSERKNYEILKSRWEKKYQIYHNLPFLNIFTTSGLRDYSITPSRSFRVDRKDFNFLKNTSVDYTLCNEKGKPLLCIEFDGMQQGFNVGLEYVPKFPQEEQAAQKRKSSIELKLKVAHGSDFPFFVLSSEEFRDLADDIKFSIVDGIIGEVFARKAVKDESNKGGLEPGDYLWIETMAEVKHNPVYKMVADLEIQLGLESWSVEFLQEPNLNTAKTWEERIELLINRRREGAKCIIHSKDFGDIESTVWFPHFKSPGFFTGLTLAEELAHLMSLTKLKKLKDGAI